MKKITPKFFAWVVYIAIGFHMIIFICLHLLVPELDPLKKIISDYLESPYPNLTRATFFIFAIALLSLTFALNAIVIPSRLSKFGLILLTCGVFGLILGGIFVKTVDPRNQPGGILLILKLFVSLARLGIPIGFICLSLVLRKSRITIFMYKWLIGISFACLLVLLLTIIILLNQDLGGLGQRLSFLLFFAWMALAAQSVITHIKHQIITQNINA